MIATEKGTKYWSAAVSGVVVGAVVGWVASGITLNVVSALDGQYPWLPAKLAYTV